MDDEQWVAAIANQAGRIARTSWWIDNRDVAPDEAAESVEAVRSTLAAADEKQFA